MVSSERTHHFQCVKEPMLSRSESMGFPQKSGKQREKASEKGVPPTPICQLFQVHGSKFKSDPSCDGGQASVVCITHRVFLFRVCKDPFNGFFALRINLSAQLPGVGLCRLCHLFLLILLLVGTGLDMGAVNENCVRIDHTVIECLVENMLENLTGQLVRKALAEGIAHRRKVWNVIQQSIPQKPAVGQIYLNFPLGLPQRRNAKQMLNEHHLDQHNRIGSGVSVVMAIVRVKSFIQPFVIHDPYTRI